MIRLLRLALAAGLVLAPSGPAGQGDNPLLGLWVSETTFRPVPHGELTLARQGGGWRAALAGAEATFAAAGDSVRFAFPDSGGSFRGAAAGDSIRGFWLRRAREIDGQAFASPLVLRRTADGVWRGTVQPLDDRFTLQLTIFYDDQHQLRAAFRIPQRNLRGVVPLLELVVVFTGGNYGQGGIWGRWRQEIVGEQIIPVIGASPDPGRR